MNISFVQFERGFDAFADYLWETKNQGKLWKVCFEADSQIWLFLIFWLGHAWFAGYPPQIWEQGGGRRVKTNVQPFHSLQFPSYPVVICRKFQNARTNVALHLEKMNISRELNWIQGWCFEGAFEEEEESEEETGFIMLNLFSLKVKTNT